jgi:hypothetical protein
VDKIIAAAGAVTVALFVICGVAILTAFPTMWAWNYAVPKTFGLPTISFLDAWCLNFLAGTFFKSSLSTTKASS